ncbi:hypothetical protein CRG98_024281 [Punica granatum]|uniref:Uncharacterized protein n=1 Tax=Punica granatum TaxID=22663 RepID=A0A2I0JG64_PUNGR|nr:hypothetical protein CRG98_024281 [Punica granatum]
MTNDVILILFPLEVEIELSFDKGRHFGQLQPLALPASSQTKYEQARRDDFDLMQVLGWIYHKIKQSSSFSSSSAEHPENIRSIAPKNIRSMSPLESTNRVKDNSSDNPRTSLANRTAIGTPGNNPKPANISIC